MKGDACNTSHTPTLKVLVLGEKGVGKTCLIRSLLNENIPEVYEPTEDNWYSTSVQISDNSQQKVHYLDTGSFDESSELIERYVTVAHIFIIVLDYSYKRTYLSARRIIRNIRRLRGNTAAVLCVSTKCDKTRGDREQPVRVMNELEHIMCSSTKSIGISDVRNIVNEQVRCIHKSLNEPKPSKISQFTTSVKRMLRLKKTDNCDNVYVMSPVSPYKPKSSVTAPNTPATPGQWNSATPSTPNRVPGIPSSIGSPSSMGTRCAKIQSYPGTPKSNVGFATPMQDPAKNLPVNKSKAQRPNTIKLSLSSLQPENTSTQPMAKGSAGSYCNKLPLNLTYPKRIVTPATPGKASSGSSSFSDLKSLQSPASSTSSASIQDIFQKYGYQRKSSLTPTIPPSFTEMSQNFFSDTVATLRSLHSDVISALK